MATVVPTPVPPPDVIEEILYSKKTKLPQLFNNDKPIDIIQKNLSPSAIRYIVKKKINIRKKIKEMKIKNSISNYALLDEILNDKNKRSVKQNCSEVLGFTFRKLTPTELTNFGFDATKTFYIIDSVSCGSVAEIIGFKVGDVIIGMYNSNNTTKQLLDYNDEEALYNLKGNLYFDDKTILYINISVFRYDKKLKTSYVDIKPLFEKYDDNNNVFNVLYHGRRFIIPYLHDPDNTITRFGSLYFKDYISDLTDFAQVGGGQVELAQYNVAENNSRLYIEEMNRLLRQCDDEINRATVFVDANPAIDTNHKIRRANAKKSDIEAAIRRATPEFAFFNHGNQDIAFKGHGVSTGESVAVAQSSQAMAGNANIIEMRNQGRLNQARLDAREVTRILADILAPQEAVAALAALQPRVLDNINLAREVLRTETDPAERRRIEDRMHDLDLQGNLDFIRDFEIDQPLNIEYLQRVLLVAQNSMNDQIEFRNSLLQRQQAAQAAQAAVDAQAAARDAQAALRQQILDNIDIVRQLLQMADPMQQQILQLQSNALQGNLQTVDDQIQAALGPPGPAADSLRVQQAAEAALLDQRTVSINLMQQLVGQGQIQARLDALAAQAAQAAAGVGALTDLNAQQAARDALYALRQQINNNIATVQQLLQMADPAQQANLQDYFNTLNRVDLQNVDDQIQAALGPPGPAAASQLVQQAAQAAQQQQHDDINRLLQQQQQLLQQQIQAHADAAAAAAAAAVPRGSIRPAVFAPPLPQVPPVAIVAPGPSIGQQFSAAQIMGAMRRAPSAPPLPLAPPVAIVAPGPSSIRQPFSAQLMGAIRSAVSAPPLPQTQSRVVQGPGPFMRQQFSAPTVPVAIRRAPSAPPPIAPRIMVGLRTGILRETEADMLKQRILLINLYLNQIFNKIILNYKQKKLNPTLDDLTIKSTYKYKDKTDPSIINHAFNFPDFPVKKINGTNDEKIISKINSLLDQDKLISLTSCDDESASSAAAAAGGSGGLNKNKNMYPLRRRKQKTIKKKIRNIKNKYSLKHKIKNKINKCIKKCIKKNSIQQQKKEKQKENKVRIKKFLNSKIYEKINKFKLNKTKNYSKNKSYSNKYTRKNY